MYPKGENERLAALADSTVDAIQAQVRKIRGHSKALGSRRKLSMFRVVSTGPQCCYGIHAACAHELVCEIAKVAVVHYGGAGQTPLERHMMTWTWTKMGSPTPDDMQRLFAELEIEYARIPGRHRFANTHSRIKWLCFLLGGLFALLDSLNTTLAMAVWKDKLDTSAQVDDELYATWVLRTIHEQPGFLN